jgi:hypothetical protein
MRHVHRASGSMLDKNTDVDLRQQEAAGVNSLTTQLRRVLDQLDATPPCRLLTLKVIALLHHADSV